jgi:hypothetical protein
MNAALTLLKQMHKKAEQMDRLSCYTDSDGTWKFPEWATTDELRAQAFVTMMDNGTEAEKAECMEQAQLDKGLDDDEDCDVVAEDDGSLHVVAASGLDEGPEIADYDAVSLFPSAMGEQHCGDEEDENFDEYGHCKHCGWFPELMHSHVRHAMHISCVYISEKYDLSEYDPDMETAPLHEECSE